MPELPEVEHIGRWLRPQLVGRRIHRVNVLPGAERCLPQGQCFLGRLRGKPLGELRRRAKLLMIPAGEETLTIHLKMTGQLWPLERLPSVVAPRVVLHFENGGGLVYADQRKFGWLQVWDRTEIDAWQALQGPEPVPRLPKAWSAAISGQRTLKGYLLDTRKLAGVGNIYADEILFRARLHPQRPAGGLTLGDRINLQTAIEKEMTAAVRERKGEPDQKRVGGGDRSVKALFRWKVYQRAGEACVRCGKSIRRIEVAGRGTYYCAHCQV